MDDERELWSGGTVGGGSDPQEARRPPQVDEAGQVGSDPTRVNPAAVHYAQQQGPQGANQAQNGPYQGQRADQHQQRYAQQTQQYAQQQAQQYAQQQEYARQQYAQQQRVTQSEAMVPAKKQRMGLKVGLAGLAGGAIGALAVTLALSSSGVLGAVRGTGSSTGAADSSAGRTVQITADSEDMTVAQAVSTKALPSVVSVYVTTSEGSGLGSGVMLDTDGNILTNWHVTSDAIEISVTIDGKSYAAELVGGDASSDLAVIHADLQGATVTPIEVGDSDSLVVGDWVMTIGSPFGLDQSVSSGIVSSLSRNEMLQSMYGTTLYTNLIQTDAAINPGNSGGALVNSKGQLVGICTLFSSDTESFAGIGFAIPGNYAVEVANKIIAGEQVTHAFIGLSMQTVNAQNAQANGLSVNQGAYVAEVMEGSPAEAAGIQAGDIIIAMDGEEITSADGMILAVRSQDIGETVSVTVMRGAEELTFDVTLGSDEELQALQQQQVEEQQRQGLGGGSGSGEGITDGYGDTETLNELYEYLFRDRGGAYDTGA